MLKKIYTWKAWIFLTLVPLPEGWGKENPCIWNKEPVDAWEGFNSIKPHMQSDVTIRTKFLIDSWASFVRSFSNLKNKSYNNERNEMNWIAYFSKKSDRNKYPWACLKSSNNVEETSLESFKKQNTVTNISTNSNGAISGTLCILSIQMETHPLAKNLEKYN